MKIDLSGKSALVSASSARIGMAVADGLAAMGFSSGERLRVVSCRLLPRS